MVECQGVARIARIPPLDRLDAVLNDRSDLIAWQQGIKQHADRPAARVTVLAAEGGHLRQVWNRNQGLHAVL